MIEGRVFTSHLTTPVFESKWKKFFALFFWFASSPFGIRTGTGGVLDLKRPKVLVRVNDKDARLSQQQDDHQTEKYGHFLSHVLYTFRLQ